VVKILSVHTYLSPLSNERVAVQRASQGKRFLLRPVRARSAATLGTGCREQVRRCLDFSCL
jgi:hypothetical protein